MSNELQIKLSADITALQSALTKAKTTIKSFESDTAKESEKGNVGFRRKIGLIEQLTNKSKQLRVALSQATNEKQVEQYNQELEQTAKELTRLNALGRTVSSSLGSASGGFANMTRSSSSANGAVQEFGRTIQDAPYAMNNFGSIANNLTRAMELFTFEVRNAGSASKAASNIFASMGSPMNIALLAVSALASAFTVYQMWAASSADETEELVDEVDRLSKASNDYLKTLTSVQRAQIEGEKQGAEELVRLNSLYRATQDTTLSLEQRKRAVDQLQETYPKVFGNLRDELILTGQATKSYNQLTQSILANAKAKASEDTLVENEKTLIQLLNEREKVNKTIEDSEKRIDELSKDVTVSYGQRESLGKTLADSEKRLLEPALVRRAELSKEINELTKDNIGLVEQVGKAQKDVIVDLSSSDGGKNKVKEPVDIEFVVDKIEVAESNEEKKRIKSSIEKGAEQAFEDFNKEDRLKAFKIDIAIEPNLEVIKPQGGAIQELQKMLETYKTIVDTTFDPAIISEYNLKIQETQEVLKMLNEVGTEEMTSFADILGESFMSLGNQIAQATGLAKTGWEGFARIILTNAPKIIQAVLAEAKAKRVAAEIANQANLTQATGNAILGATQTANSAGPFATYVLPALIAGAVALVSGAFGKSGGGGAPAASGAPPQIFTNQNTVSPPSATSPNYTESGAGYDTGNEQGRLTVDLDVDTLRFALDMNKEKKQSGG